MAVDDVWQIAAKGKFQGQDVVNVFHFRSKGAGNTFSLMAQSVRDAWLAPMQQQQDNDLVWTLISGRQLVGGEAVGELALIPNIVGDQTVAQPLPTQVALLCSLRTGQAGRRKRGRLYIPGYGVDQMDNGRPRDPLVSTVQGIANQFLALYGAGGSDGLQEWGVFSRVNGGTPIPGTSPVQYGPPWFLEGFTPITEVIVRDVWATQRRRRIGVGS